MQKNEDDIGISNEIKETEVYKDYLKSNSGVKFKSLGVKFKSLGVKFKSNSGVKFKSLGVKF